MSPFSPWVQQLYLIRARTGGRIEDDADSHNVFQHLLPLCPAQLLPEACRMGARPFESAAVALGELETARAAPRTGLATSFPAIPAAR